MGINLKLYTKDINFLPQRIIQARQRRKNTLIFALVASILLTTMLVGALLPQRITRTYQQQLATVNHKLAQLDQAEPYYVQMTALQQQVADKEQAVQEIETQLLQITPILQQINSVLPVNCFISQLTLEQDGKFVLEVLTNNPVETAQVQVGLRNLGLFKEVSLADVDRDPLDEQQEQQDFAIIISQPETDKNEDGEFGRGEVPFTQASNKQRPVRFNLVLLNHDIDENHDIDTQRDDD